MAKKKSDDVLIESIDQLEKDITKEYGEGVITSGQDFLDEPQMIIPFSPCTDVILSGGVPEGSWLTVTGPEKIGKTTSLLQFAATCQRPEYGSREIWYFNIEGRLKKMNLTGIHGLDISPEKFKVVGSREGKILTAEEILDIAVSVITERPRIVAIMDSYSALCSSAETTKNVGDATMGGTSLLQGRFVRKLSHIVPINKTIILGITHQTSNISGYGAASQEKSSRSLKYQADIKLKATKKEPWKVGEKQIGQIITWFAETSALGPPAGITQSYLRYGHGIDELTEIIILATDIGLIDVKGSWYVFEIMGEEFKIQGLDSTYNHFANNEIHKTYLYEKVKSML